MKKILIIDYDQNSLAALQGIFAGEGYEVVTAGDGQAGWDKYNKESPDLVLMEAMLPKVHGFELCQRITSERNSQATVFIMTGVYKDRVYRTEALRTYGASEYFEKPLKMTELMASVQAVLGKPENRPAPAPQAEAAPEPRPEAARVKRERPRSDDSIFALPDDLDRLSRESPKTRLNPAGGRREPAADPGFEKIADELLKTVIVESSTPETFTPKPEGGNGNGNGGSGADIDQFLRSALAGLDLKKDKVKAARPASQPAPAVRPPAPEVKPAPAPPVRPIAPEVKPAPVPPIRPAAQEVKPVAAPPAPVRPPAPPETRPAATHTKPLTPPPADMKNTLTPGDPGSDVSPFFKPEAPKPPDKAERKPAPPPPRREAPKPEPIRPMPPRSEPARPAPAAPEPKREEPQAFAPAGIFQDISAPREKKGLPKLVVVGLAVVALAAAGLILLRPKRPAPAAPPPEEPAVTAPQQAETSAGTFEEAPPLAAEEAPVKKKADPPAKTKDQPPAKPQNKPAEATASAILPTQTAAPDLPMPGPGLGAGADTATSGPGTKGPSPDAPAAKTESKPSPGQAQTAAGPGQAPSAAAPAEPPVNEGDLVDLGSVTEPPQLVKKVDPVYPMAAQRSRREGSITVNALIDEKGDVIDTGILKGLQDDRGLGRAAETAVRRWKFQPARKNGVAVKVWKPFIIVFKAEGNPAV